jgi:hypothetical protein
MKLFKLDFWAGRKSYIIGILMILHGGSQVVMDLISGKQPSDMNITEVLTGFGIIFLRKGINERK